MDVGSSVTKFAVGDKVGVGCMVESCRACHSCKVGEEQYCDNSCVYTYNSKEKFPHCAEYNSNGGEPTYGGYSEHILVNEDFVLRIPDNLDLAAATPLLCAGITTYSPMAKFNLKPGQKLGVVGLGGLGHTAVKIGVAMGVETTVLSRGTSKRESALNHLGAHRYIDSSNAEEMSSVSNYFDLIIDTVCAKHDIAGLINLLTLDGRVVLVGVAPDVRLEAHGLIGKQTYAD